jgi:simple sugar transport system permease protein
MNTVKEKMKLLIQPMLAMILAIITVWMILKIAGYDAGLTFQALMDASFKNMKSVGTMLNRSAPLLFAGLAVAVAFRSNVINIGAEGQLLFGAIAATCVGYYGSALPGFLLITLMIISGALAGAFWGFIPGVLKATLGVSEVITTIMFNYVAKFFISFLVRGPMGNPIYITPQSFYIAEQAMLPSLIPGTKLHIGFFLGVVAAIILYVILFKFYFGFEIRAVGFSSSAAKTNGINVNKTMILTMIISGGLAGIGGAIEVGAIHYLSDTLSPGYGFTAIAVSVLAANNPLGIIFTSGIFGFLSAGSTAMQRVAGVSGTFVQVFQGLIVIFVSIAAVKNLTKKRRLSSFIERRQPEKKEA